MTNEQTLAIFRRYTLLSSLDETLFNSLCKSIEIREATAGTTLFKQHSNDTLEYFLVSGSVTLSNDKQPPKIIEAGLPNSNHPLSPSKPRQHSATCNGLVQYFTLPSSVIHLLQEKRKRQSDAVTHMAYSSDCSHEALYKHFEHELSRGYFVIPSFPETAINIRLAIEQPDCDINQVVNLAHSDPGISAKLIKTANSVLYKGVSSCDNITNAVMRLGLSTTKQLVTSFAILSLFESDSPLLKQQMELARKKSILVASYAFVLAEKIPSLNSEEAMLASLLHQIGKIIILSYAEQHPKFDQQPLQLALAIHQLSSHAGKLALEAWGFSQQLITVVAESNQTLRQNPKAIDYCDLIILCKLLALGNDEQQPQPLSSLPAWQKIQQQLQQQTIGELINEQQQRLAEVRSLFI
ncbi:HDOD domain-containing protein [Dasania sp. GY-MA-18]|uniref:HDOD domain-containing protein n=1 Tax=Dasania phycosphaerae TaxID=2950436 RepID=A0A9J6RNA0_9GAMM|nr:MULTISPECIES: HDOD domain-containing protein [Dasania]MCR8923224.1 HDOD domain-containing protein [Dasania sp. GY-MA-18]MCZ0865656.1 HDOD domain-containing protein [Dasania phycosphaerae]MCZ0869381.1 HDOD domain-containing protein [Dasania phycosphaerae]